MNPLKSLRESGRQEEVVEKQRRVVSFLDAHGLDGILLTRRDNFAWYTGGGNNHIPTSQEHGVATLFVNRDGATLLTANIESARLLEEELAGIVHVVRTWPWHEDPDHILGRLIAGKKVVSDAGLGRSENGADAIRPLRYCLTPNELRCYTALGAAVAEALEGAARGMRPGETEHAIGARLAHRLLEMGIEPTVNLVAVDERIHRHRHPLPTDRRLDRYAMLVTCARFGGLIVAATRLVHLGPLPGDRRSKYEALLQVENAFYAGTRVGRRACDILGDAIAAYDRAGYGEEWKLHHQGGAIGYDNREWVATHGLTETVNCHQAFAWNPSITGAKLEDTVVLTESGLEVVTNTGDWPTLDVAIEGRTVPRPEILVRRQYW